MSGLLPKETPQRLHQSYSLLLFTTLKVIGVSKAIICDVAGENRPTGAYFIIEFDITKVVIGIFRRKISYDILLLYRSSTIH